MKVKVGKKIKVGSLKKVQLGMLGNGKRSVGSWEEVTWKLGVSWKENVELGIIRIGKLDVSFTLGHFNLMFGRRYLEVGEKFKSAKKLEREG